LQSLDRAILEIETALSMTPRNHPLCCILLARSARFHFNRFEALGNVADINVTIERHQTAMSLAPDDNLLKQQGLLVLGIALKNRFQRLGNLDDIDRALVHLRKAASLMRDDYPGKPSCLNNLGTALRTRFERLGTREDIDEAIVQQRAAINLIPSGHKERPGLLNDLGNSFQARFRSLGNLADIDRAITQEQVAVNLTPDDDSDKHTYLSNLGISFQFRFERLGNPADLDNGIIRLQEAVNLTPDSHIQKYGILYNLAGSLRNRFERSGNLVDIDLAISYGRKAASFIPDNHPGKPLALNNLGNALRSRFKRLKNIVDLNDAITQLQAAVKLTSDSDPDRSRRLTNLGMSLVNRFECTGNPADIDDGIAQCQTAVNLTRDDYPGKAGHLSNLGYAFGTRFHRNHHYNDAEAAIHNLGLAAKFQAGPPSIRFAAVRRWISVATLINHQSLLEACECAIGLLPTVAWLGLPVADRHEQLIEVGEVARDAAAIAISFEQHEKALEWLEQGRSIVWNQILQLRTPVDELRIINPDLADRLVKVSRLIDRGPTQVEALRSTEEDGQRYRALTSDWESIIEQVRSLPNFEDFLKPTKLLRLKDAANSGPVVFLNVSMLRCDALALVPGLDEVLHIPLPNIKSKRITEIRDDLKDLLYSDGLRMRGERAAKKVEDGDELKDCADILAELWNGIVKPVLDSLAFPVWKASYMHLNLVTPFT
jgi:hypothetical protein